MATYSYPTSLLERFQGLSSRCEHKSSTYCLDISPRCCSCSDFSVPSGGYLGPERWSKYCLPCQYFWKSQPEAKTSEYPKPAATEHPQRDGSNPFARLNAPLNAFQYIPKISSRIVSPAPTMVPSRPVIITSQPLKAPSPSPALRVLPPPQNSPLRKKKWNSNNKKPAQNSADVDQDSDKPEESPSNSQNENTPGAEPPVVTVPAYVCPAARAGARKVSRGTGAVSVPAQAEEQSRRWSLTSLYSAPGSSEGSTSSSQRHNSYNIARENSRGNQTFCRPRATGTSYQAPRGSGAFYNPPTQLQRSSGTYVPPPARNPTENRNLLSEWRPARLGDMGNLRSENNTTATKDSTQETRYRSRTWEGTPVPDPPDGSWSSDIVGDWRPQAWTGWEAADAHAEQSPTSANSRSRPPSRDQLPQVQSQGPTHFGNSNSPITESGPSNASRPLHFGDSNSPTTESSSSSVSRLIRFGDSNSSVTESGPSNGSRPLHFSDSNSPTTESSSSSVSRPIRFGDSNSSVTESGPSNFSRPMRLGNSNSPVTGNGPSNFGQNAASGWLEWTSAFFTGNSSDANGPPATRDSPVSEVSWDAPLAQHLSSNQELRRYTLTDSQSGGASSGPLPTLRKHLQDAHSQTPVQRTNSTTPRQTQRPKPQYRRTVGTPVAPTILPISSPQAQHMVAPLPTILNPNFHDGESDEDNVWSNLSPSRRRQGPSNEPTAHSALLDEHPRPQAVNPRSPVPPRPPMSPAVSDEWEQWDSKAWETAALKSNPEQVNLAQIAEDASVLLELFSKTKPRNNVDIGNEHKEMIENAFQSIMKIRKEFRLIATQKNESISNLAPPEGGEGAAASVDPECIICYTHIADTVVLPCKHLVLCMTCCDKIGIKEKAQMTNTNIQCPICRTKVEDRLKIFRG